MRRNRSRWRRKRRRRRRGDPRPYRSCRRCRLRRFQGIDVVVVVVEFVACREWKVDVVSGRCSINLHKIFLVRIQNVVRCLQYVGIIIRREFTQRFDVVTQAFRRGVARRRSSQTNLWFSRRPLEIDVRQISSRRSHIRSNGVWRVELRSGGACTDKCGRLVWRDKGVIVNSVRCHMCRIHQIIRYHRFLRHRLFPFWDRGSTLRNSSPRN